MWRPLGGIVLASLAQLPGCSQEPAASTPQAEHPAAKSGAAGAPLVAPLSPQARKNLGLMALAVQPATYWRTIETPGVVVDRPGVSDRGVVSPVTGVVTNILAYPGDTVEPDQPLFLLRLASERLHASQLELFKAAREIEIVRRERQRLAGLAESGAVAQSRIIELDNRVQMLDVNVQAYRQDLLARGLPAERVEAAARGEFVTEIAVRAPSRAMPAAGAPAAAGPEQPFRFEVQTLHVGLGQQVEAGALLSELADHRALLIEGHAFQNDLPLLQEAVRLAASVEADFDEPAGQPWQGKLRPLAISHVANTVDPETRVINYLVPLANEWRAEEREGKRHLAWRYRPGQRVRLRVPVEKLENVFVLPRTAVVREGAEAFVFRQNGDLFDRRPVHVLDESRTHVALASDGSIKPGMYLAQNGAAALNRILKAQSSQRLPAGVHVHADGSVHGAH